MINAILQISIEIWKLINTWNLLKYCKTNDKSLNGTVLPSIWINNGIFSKKQKNFIFSVRIVRNQWNMNSIYSLAVYLCIARISFKQKELND